LPGIAFHGALGDAVAGITAGEDEMTDRPATALTGTADVPPAGILPLAAAFLVWLVVKSLLAASAPQLWSVAGVVVVGIVLMFLARFVLQSPFFQDPRESAPREG
jgi:hypothetical protein